MPDSNRFLTLLTAAEAYFHLGYSVIPLLGDLDPSRPKVPAIFWGNFQQHCASLNDYKQWFSEGGFGGLGIVTGCISQLVVLDFDSQNIFENFKVQFPALLETHTVQSAGRQLPHLYFRLPPHLHLPSMKGQGVDLLSDGCYVVAPPTSINGQAYKIIRGGMPRTLTERDIHRLQAFMNSNKLISRSTNHENLNPVIIRGEKVTQNDLLALYQRLCIKSGRNEALYLTSLRARDSGWSQQQAAESLIPLHIQQPSSGAHPREKPEQRQREALRTIRSAYSHPARPITTPAPRNSLQLSNSVREKLLQLKMTCVVRTYEALLHIGIHPGQVITAKEAVERLSGLVGRFSVLNALKAGQGDQRFFSLPVNPSKTASAVASDNTAKTIKPNVFEESKLQQKPHGGRPQHLFRMPTNEELCSVLGVEITGSDPLQAEDLASAPKTRMALHRELIKRRPGQYPRGWLARRLGVNKRTIAAYNRLIPIHSRAMHIETGINWKTIEQLPFDEPIQGAVLITNNGKRYPALRTIASRLLAKGEVISLKQQTVNYYWFGDEPLLARLQIQQEGHLHQERIETFMAHQTRETPMSQHEPVSLAPLLRAQPVLKEGNGTNKPLAQHDYRKPLKNASQEAQAKQVYEALNKQLSLANARRLVITYQEPAIAAALQLVCQRSEPIHRVGFFISLLQSNTSITPSVRR